MTDNDETLGRAGWAWLAFSVTMGIVTIIVMAL